MTCVSQILYLCYLKIVDILSTFSKCKKSQSTLFRCCRYIIDLDNEYDLYTLSILPRCEKSLIQVVYMSKIHYLRCLDVVDIRSIPPVCHKYIIYVIQMPQIHLGNIRMWWIFYLCHLGVVDTLSATGGCMMASLYHKDRLFTSSGYCRYIIFMSQIHYFQIHFQFYLLCQIQK